ncbi:MAG TPA: hypothetical protein VKU87_02105 [Thermomicrobiaceae bacterium]|nr:hypothetical protein [Thermomicrobiaceae bacterium]
MGASWRGAVGLDGDVIRSGLIAGAGFLVSMAIDLAIVKNKADDLVLLGGLTPLPERHWRLAGAVMHFVNSVIVALAFDRLRSHLSWIGNRQLRGLFFLQIENLLLYPLLLLIEPLHPARRAGKLANFRDPVVFLQEIFRHPIFGLVLGTLLDREGAEN